MSEPENEAAATPTLAQKLTRLFETMRPEGKAAPGTEAVAKAITARGTAISGQYLWLLRTGQRTNPTVTHLQAIADYFGVPASYFLDDKVAAEVDAELELLRSMRDSGVKQLALRASGLSPDSLRAIAALVENARRLERLPADETPDPSK